MVTSGNCAIFTAMLTRFFVPYAAALCLALSWCAQAQPVTYSAIVGYDRLTLPGTGSGTTQLSFSGLSLVPNLEYAGNASANGTNTLTDSTATWANDQFNGLNGAFYVEVVSINGSTTAAGVGSTYTIADTTAPGTLTLAKNLAAGVTAPLGYRIRKHWTIATVFGPSNSAGLQGGTPVTADQIQVWNGNGYDVYYYQTSGIGGTGWRKVGDQSTDASATVIEPGNSLITKRGVSGAATVTLVGMVKTGITSVTINPGYNFVPNPNAANMTLLSCGLYTTDAATGVASGSATSADQVLLWNGTGYNSYYYQSAGLGGTGWRKSGDQTTDASATVIAPGTSFIVRRVNPGAFVWAIPQHPASL